MTRLAAQTPGTVPPNPRRTVQCRVAQPKRHARATKDTAAKLPQPVITSHGTSKGRTPRISKFTKDTAIYCALSRDRVARENPVSIPRTPTPNKPGPRPCRAEHPAALPAPAARCVIKSMIMAPPIAKPAIASRRRQQPQAAGQHRTAPADIRVVCRPCTPTKASAARGRTVLSAKAVIIQKLQKHLIGRELYAPSPTPETGNDRISVCSNGPHKDCRPLPSFMLMIQRGLSKTAPSFSHAGTAKAALDLNMMKVNGGHPCAVPIATDDISCVPVFWWYGLGGTLKLRGPISVFFCQFFVITPLRWTGIPFAARAFGSACHWAGKQRDILRRVRCDSGWGLLACAACGRIACRMGGG